MFINQGIGQAVSQTRTCQGCDLFPDKRNRGSLAALQVSHLLWGNHRVLLTFRVHKRRGGRPFRLSSNLQPYQIRVYSPQHLFQDLDGGLRNKRVSSVWIPSKHVKPFVLCMRTDSVVLRVYQNSIGPKWLAASSSTCPIYQIIDTVVVNPAGN